MVEKFTIADGRQRVERGGTERTPMIERVEWADRKITGYAERRQTDGRSERTATRRNGHFGHELGECGVHIMARGRDGR